MQLTGKRLRLSKASGPSPWRLLVWLSLILAGVAVLWFRETGRIQPLFLPPPTPTRTGFSHSDEGQTLFLAGDLPGAIAAYQEAVRVDPTNAGLWAELARIQTYSSALLTDSAARRLRLDEAREAIDRGVELNPDSSFAQAIRALVYDWSASAEDLNDPENLRDEHLTEAKGAVARALAVDPGDPLALAFQAEVLLDEQSFQQALDRARNAADIASELGPNYPYTMDIHRVYGTVLEGWGFYADAILQYLEAADRAPNFTYLYLSIGANYRQLRQVDTALEYFDRAVRINEQLGIQDPTPYLAIGKTYLQQGQFFAAAINIEQALAISPSTADIYGRLGIVFFKARNYESAVVALECAVDGCTPDTSRNLLCEYVFGCDPEADEAAAVGVDVQGLDLRDDTLEYYYTYGAVLAYFRGEPDVPQACTRAERVFQALMALYGDDPVVAEIVAESRGLCAGQAAPTQAFPTPGPGSTPGS